MHPSGSVSQQDIARAVGVSVATVSRALKNDPMLSAATRSRVLVEAERLGYRPNPLVTALMTQVRGRAAAASTGIVLAYVDMGVTPDAWLGHAVTRDWFAGATLRAEQLGYRLERFFPMSEHLTRERLTGILLARGITGVLFPVFLRDPPSELTAEDLPLEIERFSIVTLGGEYNRPVLHFAANDQYATARRAAMNLRRLGYRRPGLIIDPGLDLAMDNRFLSGFFSLDWPAVPAPAVPPLYVKRWEQDRFNPWFEAHRPDVLVSNHAATADWLHALGRRIPEDTAFACLDWEPALGDEIAGMDQRSAHVAMAAVDMLADLVARHEPGAPAVSRGTRIDGVWRDGASAPQVGPEESRVG